MKLKQSTKNIIKYVTATIILMFVTLTFNHYYTNYRLIKEIEKFEETTSKIITFKNIQ